MALADSALDAIQAIDGVPLKIKLHRQHKLA